MNHLSQLVLHIHMSFKDLNIVDGRLSTIIANNNAMPSLHLVGLIIL